MLAITERWGETGRGEKGCFVSPLSFASHLVLNGAVSGLAKIKLSAVDVGLVIVS